MADSILSFGITNKNEKVILLSLKKGVGFNQVTDTIKKIHL
jgi:hypothetical protein